jgi:hypothetical protein
MSVLRGLASASVFIGLLLSSVSASASEPTQALSITNLESISIAQNSHQESGKRIRKLLTDHPGSATALTETQKSEIRAFVTKAKGKKALICRGLSLSGQRESMYRVVRLRAELVCDYAKSLDSSLKTTIWEKTTNKSNQNGRVVVSSK